MVRHLSGYKLPLQLQRPLPSQGLQKLEDKFHTNLLEKPSHQIRVGVLLVRNVLQNALHRLLPSLYPHRPEVLLQMRPQVLKSDKDPLHKFHVLFPIEDP